MMIDTEKSSKSGPGTSMFSRSGASTIQQHSVFGSKYQNINDLITDAKARKTAKRSTSIAGGDNDDGAAANGNLPRISENEENQAIVEIPGLSSELNKIEKSYQQKAEGQAKYKRNSTIIEDNIGGNSASNGFDAPPKKREINLETLHKLSRAQFEEVTAAHFNSSRKHQSPEFLSVGRSNRLLREAYLKKTDGSNSNYTPKLDLIQSRITQQITINAARRGEPRSPMKIPPSCVADQTLCNLEKRINISKARNATSLQPSPEPTLQRDPSDDNLDEQSYRHQQSHSEIPDLDSTARAYLHTTTTTTRKVNDRSLTETKINMDKISNLPTINMEKTTGRPSNSILQGYAPVCDNRFQSLKGNIEIVSKYKKSPGAPNIKGTSSRSELWGTPTAQPDFIGAGMVNKRNWAPKSVIPFKSAVGHQREKKPFSIPDGYSYDTLRKGFEATTVLKKPKTLVNMAHSPNRDNSMYEHLDAEYIKAVKRERRQKNFDLSNYLPNSLKSDQSQQVHSQMSLRGGPQLDQSMISDSSKLYQKVSMSAHKGHHTSSVNRLASLADQETHHGESTYTFTNIVSRGPTMSQFDGVQSSQNQRGKSSSYVSLQKAAPQGSSGRSNSMFGYIDPVKKVTPIEGSFICMDNNRRKLSDLGKYKIDGRNVLNNRSIDGSQTLLVDAKARFVKF